MKKCFECEKTEDQIEVHDHHVVPRSMGGVKTIPLCYVCHAIVHDRSAVSIKELTKAALQNKKSRGERVGTIPYGFKMGEGSKLVECPHAQDVLSMVRNFRADKMTWDQITIELNTQGIYNRKGQPWNKSNLWQCCKNKIAENP